MMTFFLVTSHDDLSEIMQVFYYQIESNEKIVGHVLLRQESTHSF